MLNKLKTFARTYGMFSPGDRVVCAVSGGADSMALLWAMYLMQDTLQIELSAAHFNHHLRGAESDRDEAFVRQFCKDYHIPFFAGSGQVTAGEKGLEAAAREARYAFLRSLPGKIATAHTADDNAETVLLHLVRGTGLKGLGGIAPVSGAVVRPMLEITRIEVLAFLEEYGIPYVEDSSNAGDAFLRNRLRHTVMPLLQKENPSLSRNLSAMALRLREDEQTLEQIAREAMTCEVSALRKLEPGLQSRVLRNILLDAGVKEPEASHMKMLRSLVNSPNPSAKASFPGGITVSRCYDSIHVSAGDEQLQTVALTVPGVTRVPGHNWEIQCQPNGEDTYTTDSFPVCLQGAPVVRSRQEGDTIRLSGGTKSLKKLFIDKKIPAAEREFIPVIADEGGVLGVVGIGANLDRISCEKDAVRICIKYR